MSFNENGGDLVKFEKKFEKQLETYIGRNVEIGMSNGHILSGVLTEVTTHYVILLAPSVPGYDGEEEEVLIRTEDIEYVRVM
jgi:hypothetical protein